MYSIDNSVQAESTFGNHLAGNQIHTVKLKSIEKVTIEGKDDATYDVVQAVFENEDGTHQDTFFEPNAEAMTRKPNSFGGENPSMYEQFQFKFRHYMNSFNPELSKAIDNQTKKIEAKNWEELRNAIVAAIKPGVGKEVQIKLLNNNRNMAGFPAFPLSISRDGNLYPTTTFIGKKVSFTPKEITRMQNTANATATDMGSATTAVDTDLDFDLDDL